MGDTEVPGEAIEACLLRMLPREIVELLSCGPGGGGLCGISAAKFRGEIEGIGGHHSGKHGGEGFFAGQSHFGVLEALRRHAIGEDIDDLGFDLRVFDGCGEEFFSVALVESDGVEFSGADGPPARKGCADEKVGHQFLPDERLDVFGGDEVLLGGCERVGEVGQRAHEIGAAAGRGTDAEERGSLPELLGADDRDFGEVMRANEERIVVEDLSAGGLEVGVVQTDQRIAQEGSELAPGSLELLA